MEARSDNCDSSNKVRKISLTYLKKSLVNRKILPKINESQQTANDDTTLCGCDLHAENASACSCRKLNKRSGLIKLLRKHFHFRDNWNIFKSKQRIKACENTNSDNYGFSTVGWSNSATNSSSSVQLRHESTENLDIASRLLTIQPENYQNRLEQSTSSMQFPSSPRPLDLELLSFSSTEHLNDSLQDERGLSNQLFSLTRWGWYWGPISPQEAEDKLRGQPEGTFLVRDSSADHYLLSVSFRSCGKTLHSRIEHNCGLFSFYAHEGFPSIAELINHSISSSQSSVFCYSRPKSPTQPAFPVRLTKPLSRFMQVRSLQYLCRFIIRQYTALDNIHKLPIPPPLQNYLLEGYF